jgi:hypothetical protein
MKAMHGVAGLLCVLLAAGASAQVDDVLDVPIESPKGGMIELKLGSFLPGIDTEAGLTSTPYADYFGTAKLLLFEVEWERQFFQAFGSAAIGISAGYAEKYAYAKEVTGTPSANVRTGLRTIPLRLLGVYRFDVAANRWGVPLVPYAKLGLVGIPWSIVKSATTEAAGFSYGWQATGGLALQLDFLQPRMARDLDSSIGINHSYLFAEYTYQDVNNFGRPSLVLSSRYWMFGLGLEF